ncbi:cytochrome P450 [Lentithecium fluviatile CBS 122367]|uniref:Cytochrome P450 n=1 Tax=Lentithecium fluviatile CBS 122367 TaxID=1168545 RepID=A0A6G1IT95_9PLEO|nr:cytochrome P450 [Lentithecium fluviatile CBS 122367]
MHQRRRITVRYYNLFFHPLAKTPGPLLARMSTIPSFYHACKGDRHVWIWQKFQIYGDTFRATPNQVLFNNTRTYADIHGYRAEIACSSFYTAWKRDKDDDTMINVTDTALHMRKRKLVQLIELLCEGSDPDTWSASRNMATWAVSSSREDMLQFLLNAIDPETKQPAFSKRNELEAETRSLLLAGTDTSSLTITALFFYLSQYPRVLAKATAEVRSVFSSADEIVLGTALSSCKYLRACIDETLRMSHPAPSELPRQILAGGAEIDGHTYPARTEVGCAAWSMGRDESMYGDVNKYRPERWIPSADPDWEAEVRALKKSFHPFSMGRMNCTGQRLAVLELMLVSARTIWATDFRLAPGFSNGEGSPGMGWGQRLRGVYVYKDAYLTLKDGPVLQFKPRAL